MKVDWHDKWPVFNKNEELRLTIEADPEPLRAAFEWQDNFANSKDLDLGWYHKSIDCPGPRPSNY